MLNIIITLFIFLLLVTQKILLLNEESLILLCFIVFTFIVITNMGSSFRTFLQNQSYEIENSLKESLKKLLVTFNNFSILSKSVKFSFTNFTKIKNHYKSLINVLTSLIKNYNNFCLTLIYKKKLIFINKTEEQTIKLLISVIIKKLTSIINLKYFCTSSIKFTKFMCVNSILLRECIQLINVKKL